MELQEWKGTYTVESVLIGAYDAQICAQKKIAEVTDVITNGESRFYVEFIDADNKIYGYFLN